MSTFRKILINGIITIICIFLFSCSLNTNDMKIKKLEKEMSCDCRGFDFDKKFPNKENRPYSVRYDWNRKMIFGKDGVVYKIDKSDGRGVSSYYGSDLSISDKEKRYLEEFDRKEKEFDTKYAGDIKKKLRDISTITKSRNGKYYIDYPVYLEGSELPEGLITPASFFSDTFFIKYIVADNHPGDLRKFILSTEIYKDYTLRDLAAGIGQKAAYQVSSRLYSGYIEYVLTYFLKKQYSNFAERRYTAMALAEYYGNVAFCGAAESMYYYNHLLTNHQRCQIAEYISNRVYELVMVIENIEFLEWIKKEYVEELNYECFNNLLTSRYKKTFKKRKYSKEEINKIADQLELDVIWGRVRCVND